MPYSIHTALTAEEILRLQGTDKQEEIKRKLAPLEDFQYPPLTAVDETPDFTNDVGKSQDVCLSSPPADQLAITSTFQGASSWPFQAQIADGCTDLDHDHAVEVEAWGNGYEEGTDLLLQRSTDVQCGDWKETGLPPPAQIEETLHNKDGFATQEKFEARNWRAESLETPPGQIRNFGLWYGGTIYQESMIAQSSNRTRADIAKKEEPAHIRHSHPAQFSFGSPLNRGSKTSRYARRSRNQAVGKDSDVNEAASVAEASDDLDSDADAEADEGGKQQ
ncbi:hypothetical protein BD289DRAFT_60359 [Coniella lustricola]|uniref:Uncharacterized protein n=1 Tax=Coniella lustricola TaxID=2025994 RepID=A0A2T3A0S4_9PEZI|nr:hypothetical protein BD289DRAFT_60359 [Coniella lustricola]